MMISWRYRRWCMRAQLRTICCSHGSTAAGSRSVQASHGDQECLLHGIRRGLAITQPRDGGSIQPGPMALQKQAECADVACPRCQHELDVARP
jgi:hypothetical protein